MMARKAQGEGEAEAEREEGRSGDGGCKGEKEMIGKVSEEDVWVVNGGNEEGSNRRTRNTKSNGNTSCMH